MNPRQRRRHPRPRWRGRSTTPQRPEPSRSRVPPPGAYNTGRYGGQGVYGRLALAAAAVKPRASPPSCHNSPFQRYSPRASGRPGAESFPFSSTNYDRTLSPMFVAAIRARNATPSSPRQHAIAT